MKTLKIILLLLLTGVCYAQSPTLNEANLVFAYTGDKLSGSTMADLSGSGNHGTAVGGVVYGGIEGGLQFNGASVVTWSNPAFTTGDFSVEWYGSIVINGSQTIWSKYATYGWAFTILSSGKIRIDVQDGTNNAVVTGNIVITDNILNHIVISCSRSGNAVIYVNGVLDNQGSIASASNNISNGTLTMPYPLYGGLAKMKVLQAKLYNKALSQSEVTAKWNAIANRSPIHFDIATPIRNFVQATPTSLVNEPNCVFAMGSKIGSTVVDISGNSNTGTAYGGVINAGGLDGGLQFNGTSAYVSVANSASLNFGITSFSIEVYFTYKANADPKRILTKFDGGYKGYSAYISDTGRLYIQLVNTYPTNQFVVYTNSAVSVGSHHLVISVTNRSSLIIYLDGIVIPYIISDGTLAGLGDISSTSSLLLGSFPSGTQFFYGTIYSVKIYNKALSQPEVTAKWNSIAKTVYISETFQYAVGSFPREWVKVSGTFATTQISVAEGRLLKNDKYLLASAGGSIYTSATGNISNYYISYEFYTGGSWTTKSGVVSTVSTAEASFDYSTTTNRITFILATNERIAKIKITKGQTL